MKAVVAAFNQEKALVGAFSVITNLRMELFQALDLHWCWLQVVQMVGAAECRAVSFSPISSALSDSGAGMWQLTLHTGDTEESSGAVLYSQRH